MTRKVGLSWGEGPQLISSSCRAVCEVIWRVKSSSSLLWVHFTFKQFTLIIRASSWPTHLWRASRNAVSSQTHSFWSSLPGLRNGQEFRKCIWWTASWVLPPRILGCADNEWAVSGGGSQHVCVWMAQPAGPAPTGLSSLPASTMGTGQL